MKSSGNPVAIIAGTGVLAYLGTGNAVSVKTPFGVAKIFEGPSGVYVLPRHGQGEGSRPIG